MQKTIFITGTSTGLGKATAKLFQSNGWKVIATMRNPEKETELSQLKSVILLPLDVTNVEQIDSTVKQALATGDIDVVFNNAGYGLIGPMEALTDQQIVRQFETNVFGTLRVTQAFIPYFRERGKGLFITTTSIGGLIAFPFGSIYHATKWALEGWSESVAFELNQFGILVKTVSPGGIKTDFISRSLDTSSHDAYAASLQKLYAGFNEDYFTPADQIAQVVYEAATDGKDKLRYVAGADAVALYEQRLKIGDEAFRRQMGQTFLGNV
ncbi:MAG: 3-oxoacyl-(acyl-carrier protein) reductase [Bacteroidetes bacterium]|nr:3-oxoacyl-(acyl-carrier protein) reductase [Bacteroidota bacterium]